MSVILGLNAYHADSSACLLIDGKLVGAVAEERLGDRTKHSSEFPANAIKFLLADNSINLSDINYVAVARNEKANYFSKVKYSLAHPVKSAGAILEHLRRAKNQNSLHQLMANICDADLRDSKFNIVNVEHHLAHIASAYYPSPFENLTAGFSYDGSGDFASLMAAKCQGSSIDILDRVVLPNSLGFFYTAMCQYIGFDLFGEEYKVMGLAPYGDDRYRRQMQELIKLDANGWFQLNSNFFEMHSGGASEGSSLGGVIKIDRFYKDELIKLLGPSRDRNNELSQFHMDIARSTQVRFEEVAVHCMNRLHSLVPSTSLVMAGGCALNGVTNARIHRETPFKEHYLQPAGSDDGTCIGAAYHVWHHTLSQKKRFHMQHAFWGPEYSESRINAAVGKSEHLVQICEDDDKLVHMSAKMLADGMVIGWYQGRSEWGPRALGHRSILANPAISTMKNTINEKIKRRESFRPFAPSVLREDVLEYFEQDIESPFMMHVVKIKDQWRARLPAVTHVDGTGRLQTVDRQSNFLYHKLISSFKEITGLGMLLNTSFNENEPIVDTPDQAYDCFMRTDMDALCIGRHILVKRRQYSI